MRLVLHHFRCWGDKEIILEEGKFALLCGPSGSGKSTIFNAIHWCLYGTLRGVTPSSDKKAKTLVSIELPGLVIIRQKNPGLLRVFMGPDQEYQNTAAQNIIIQKFGNEDFWKASCYITQGSRNSFLTAPTADKMKLLNYLAFNDEDPSVYIARIDELVTRTQAFYDSHHGMFCASVLQFEEQRMGRYVDINNKRSPEQLAELETQIQSLKQKDSTFQQQMIEREKVLAITENIKMQLKRDTLRLETMKPLIPVELRDQEQLQNYYGAKATVRQYVAVKREMDQIMGELSKITGDQIPTVTEEEWHETNHREKLIMENKRKLITSNILYTEVAIQEAIAKLQGLLNIQDTLRAQAEFKKINTRISSLNQISPSQIPSEPEAPDLAVFDKEIEETKKKWQLAVQYFQDVQRGQDILKCPHCSKAVRYDGNKREIVASDICPSDRIKLQEALANQQQLEKAFQELTVRKQTLTNQYQQQLAAHRKHREQVVLAEKQRETELAMLSEQLGKIKISSVVEGPVLTDMEIFNYGNVLAVLRSVVVLEEPKISSERIKNFLQHNKLRNRLKELQSIEVPKLSEAELDAKIKEINDFIQAKHQEEALRQSLMENISRLQADIQRHCIPKDVSNEIRAIQEQVKKLDVELKEAQFTNQIMAKHTQLQEQSNFLEIITKRLVDLRTLRQHAVDVECHTLQNLVDSINSTISDIASMIFNEPITITLQLYKTLKTTGYSKPTVNFSIGYKNGEYDGINQLSGGEADRASLALILALCQHTMCPFLLLDESFASLDTELKETVIKAIREHCPGKAVVLILHEAVTGLFDSTLMIDN